MNFKNTLRKAASLLVELPPEEQQAGGAGGGSVDELFAQLEKDAAEQGGRPGNSKTVEQIVRDAEGPNLEEIRVTSARGLPLTADGSPDFQALYKAAGVPEPTLTAEKVLEMLASLPKELPLETRRQTVRVMLSAVDKTVGASPDTLVADASRKLAALASFVETLTRETDSFTSTTEADIATLEAQIDEKRKAILAARQQLARGSEVCAAESDRLDDVLEFFSLDVAPSKYAS
jgi:hypothetical protein